jgi:hypothetical protein
MPRGPTLKERLGRETLVELYETHGLRANLIAERFGTTASQISKLMYDYGIRRRRAR